MGHAWRSNPEQGNRRGFTLLELLVTVAVVTILMALLLPAIEKARQRGREASCTSNLKQIGVAFHDYRQDHGDRLPTGVPVAEGGVGEFFFGLGWPNPGYSNQMHRPFQALSNSLGSPKVLVCPADRQRRLQAISDFAKLTRDNVSYYSVVATPGRLDDPRVVLAGDALVPDVMVRDQTVYQGERAVAYTMWSSHAVKGTRGNLLYADGHVEPYGKEASLEGFTTAQAVYREPPGSPNTGTPPSSGSDNNASSTPSGNNDNWPNGNSGPDRQNSGGGGAVRTSPTLANPQPKVPNTPTVPPPTVISRPRVPATSPRKLTEPEPSSFPQYESVTRLGNEVEVPTNVAKVISTNKRAATPANAPENPAVTSRELNLPMQGIVTEPFLPAAAQPAFRFMWYYLLWCLVIVAAALFAARILLRRSARQARHWRDAD